MEQIARDNPGRGYQRIHGERRCLGHRNGASTIRRILKHLGPPPAPVRRDDTTRRRFLRTHASTILTCDFLHIDRALTRQRLHVFLFLETGNRHVHILRATANPDAAWTTQQARYLLVHFGDRASEFTVLIRDPAWQFTAAFDAVPADPSVTIAKIPQPMRERSRRKVRAHHSRRGDLLRVRLCGSGS